MSRMLIVTIFVQTILNFSACQESTKPDTRKNDALKKLRALAGKGGRQLKQAEQTSDIITQKLSSLQQKIMTSQARFDWVNKNNKQLKGRFLDFLHGVEKLGRHQKELSRELDNIEKLHRKAQENFKQAQKKYAKSSRRYKQAESTFQEALVYWKMRANLKNLAEKLTNLKEHLETGKKIFKLFKEGKIMKSAFVKKIKRHALRKEWRQLAQAIACPKISPRKFRTLLKAQGMDLTGKDIDHIVPRSRGGAQHPLNYRVLDASKNRSLQATWNIKKCIDAGKESCLQAILVSKYCGNYKGNLPPFR